MTRSARAWVQHGPRSLTLESLPIPEHLEEGYALARVEASGICGSDYEQYSGDFDSTGVVAYPCVIGHEPVVRIERITPAARRKWGVDVDDRVVFYPLRCNICRNCLSGLPNLCSSKDVIRPGYMHVDDGLWGSMAEYMLISANSVVQRIPDSISAEDAVMYNPLSGGFDWALTRGGVSVGDDVLIIGAGQRGLACVIACREAGANRVIISGLPSDAAKLELAQVLGASDIVVVDPADPHSLIDQIGASVVDVAIDVVPVATRPVVDAIDAVRSGGTVVLSGIKGMRAIPDFVSDKIIFKGLDVRGARAYSPRSQKLAVDAIASGRYDFTDWHTHILPLERGEEAIQILGGEIDTGRTAIHVTVTMT